MSLSLYFLPHKKRFSLISASLKFWFIQCFLDLTAMMTLILMTCLKLICNLKILNFFLYYHFTFFQPIINFKNKEQCFFFCIHEENSSQLSLHKKFSFSQKDFFNKCVQIRRKLRMYFCAVYLIIDWRMQISIRWESSSRTVFNFFYESITLSNSLDFLIIIGISANFFSWRLFLI